MWLSVPYSSHPDNSIGITETERIPGCLEAPCDLGFEFRDIRIVANNKFLEKNPAIEKLFELATIPLADITSQNLKMHNGEDSVENIQHHAEEWIAANRDTVDQWLSEAREAAQ